MATLYQIEVQPVIFEFSVIERVNVSGPFERRAIDGRGREYSEKAMKGDEGSSESPSLHPSSNSRISNEVMMTSNMR